MTNDKSRLYIKKWLTRHWHQCAAPSEPLCGVRHEKLADHRGANSNPSGFARPTGRRHQCAAPSEPLCGVRHNEMAETESAQSKNFRNYSNTLTTTPLNTHTRTHILIMNRLQKPPPNSSL